MSEEKSIQSTISFECASRISVHCNPITTGSYTESQKIYREQGSFMCENCISLLTRLSISNPNTDSSNCCQTIKTIDTVPKAYILGWMVESEGRYIKMQTEDIHFLIRMRDFICRGLTIRETGNDRMKIDFSHRDTVSQIKSVIENAELRDALLRGFFDCKGYIDVEKKNACIHSSSPLLRSICSISSIPFYENEGVVYWEGINAVDFLYSLYKNPQLLHFPKKYRDYLELIGGTSIPTFGWIKYDENAHIPEKTRFSDAGYDLHLIKKIQVKGNVHYYDTGIGVQPQFGYYFDLVGRSSISKTGWMLANNIGIIDAGYTGNIIVALIKINENMPELTLPCKLVQLIPRKMEFMVPKRIYSLNRTEREDQGGLGSKQFEV